MKYTTLASVLLVVLLLSACSSNVTPDTQNTLEAQASGWQQVGSGTVNDAPQSANNSSLALDDSGNPTVGWWRAESNSVFSIYVRRWDPTNDTWEQLGGGLNVNPISYADTLSLDVDGAGNPSVVWREFPGGFEPLTNIYVKRWNDATDSWEQLGGAVSTHGNIGNSLSLAVDSSGNPVVSWQQDYSIYVKRWNDTTDSWEQLGSELDVFPPTFAGAPSLALDSAGNPVVSWFEIVDFGNANIFVKRWDDSTDSWVSLGAELDVDPNKDTRFPSLALDPTGKPSVSWLECVPFSTCDIYVKRWDGDSWVQLGNTINNVNGLLDDDRPSLEVDSAGNPIVSWTEWDGDSRDVHVKRWNDSNDSWVQLSNSLNILSNGAALPSLALDSLGNPVVAWVENFEYLFVKRYVTTLPTILATLSPTPNVIGWNNSDVTVSFSSTTPDATCSSDILVTTETAGQEVSGTCTDSAGDSSTTSITVKLDKTPPTIEVTGVTEGGTYTSIPTVGCLSTDTLSGIAAEATPSIADNGGGSFTATCTNTDRAGNGSSASVTYSVGVTDTTAPTTTITLSPDTVDGSNGWYKTPVTATVSTTDTDVTETRCILDPATVPASFDDLPAGCAYLTPSSVGDGQHTLYTASIDNIENKETPKTVAFKIDTVAPIATANVSPAANGNGWNNSDVTVSFTGTDDTSGIASCDPDEVFTSDGANQSASGICTDNAGNSSSAATATINLDKTAPTVTVTGVSEGGSYVLGSVPSAGCDTTDALSGVATNATLAVTGGNPDGTGTLTATCSGGTDNADNTATNVSVTYTVTPASDTTPPVVTPTITGTLGTNGWYRTNVSLTWTVSDPESTISAQTGCVSRRVTTDTTGVTYTCSATSAGGTMTNSVTIKRDATRPTISYVGASPDAPNANGWYNTIVTVSFTGTDATSGIAACPDVVLSSEGLARKARGQCTDNAGNIRKLSSPEFNIDKSAPKMRVTGVAGGRSYPVGSVPVAGCLSSDGLSGVAVQATVSVTTSSGASSNPPTLPGSYTATCSGAKDNADNLATPVSVTFTVR